MEGSLLPLAALRQMRSGALAPRMGDARRCVPESWGAGIGGRCVLRLLDVRAQGDAVGTGRP